MPLLDETEARLAVGVADSDTSVDDLLAGFVDGITSVVEDYKGEIIDQQTITEQVALNGHWQFVLRCKPVIEITSLTTFDTLTTWDLDTLTVDSKTGIVSVTSGSGYPYGRFTVVYEAGYEEMPQRYKEGAKVALSDLWDAYRGVGTEQSGALDPSEAFDPGVVLSRKARAWLGPPGVGLP